MASEYFSWDNFREIARIDHHLNFASGILRQFAWEPREKGRLANMLRRIFDKLDDAKLNISVVGEFNSGKSTFINALLRRPLVVSSAIQGSTVANTIIESTPAGNPNHSMEVMALDGTVSHSFYSDLQHLVQALSQASTNPRSARSTYAIKAILPLDRLPADIRIIDTPGTNSLEAWHTDVTLRALDDLSDISIVLVDAMSPLPSSQQDFLDGALGKALGECVFVVTRIDNVPERERPRLLKYVQVVASKLTDAEPLVLPYYSQRVLQHFVDGIPADTWVEQSLENEKIIFQYALKNKAKMVAKKLAELISRFYEHVGTNVDSLLEQCTERLAALQTARQTDLVEFIGTQKIQRSRQLTNLGRDHETMIHDKLESVFATRTRLISRKIIEAESEADFTSYLQDHLKADIERVAKSAQQILENALSDQIQNLRQVMADFKMDFNREFRRLNTLGINLETLSVGTLADTSVNEKLGVSELVADISNTDSMAQAGGLAAGAAIGTMAFPGLGTLIGGFVGSVIGLFFTPSLSSRKAKFLEQLEPQLKSYYHRLESETVNAFAAQTRRVEQSLTANIDAYLTAYQAEVDRQIRQQQARRIELEQQIADTRQTRELIRAHASDLSSFLQYF